MSEDPRDGSYAAAERRRAVQWKRRSGVLPAAARLPGSYLTRPGEASAPPRHHCLPAEFAEHNLLSEVRDGALALFEESDIPWHPVDARPSNHLLSSQVQCVNALGRMVHDPTALLAAFGPTLGTAAVLEVEPGRHLTFEYIGPKDYFGEAANGERRRGTMCTSVDAAFLHRTVEGIVELVLVEWKYTESYWQDPVPAKTATRRARYGAALDDPAGPVRADLVPFEALLLEPFYQLMRQQLLAHQLELDRVLGADVVRVVHVHPCANLDYQRSVADPRLQSLGATVEEVWSKLLRTQDRYSVMESSLFLDTEVTSAEYVARYGPSPHEGE